MSELLHYSLDECLDNKKVIDRLSVLENDGKISYDIDNDILEIEDIDLTDKELENLLKLFYDNDVIEYKERSDDSDDGFEDFYDEGDDY